MAIVKAKGTYDVLPTDSYKWSFMEDKIRQVCQIFNYEEIRTPIFEASELFHRTVGETSDLVKKETYDFKDRGDRLVTLRPEGTAGVVRAFIENKMFVEPINKLFYIGSMFRYERPQKGRYRQFNQFGVECFGSSDPIMDAEVISLAVTIIRAFNLKGIKVRLNTLGDDQTRETYKKALVEYFTQYRDVICPDCQVRLEKNPLRILDCKVDRDTEIFKNAPKIIDYLSDEAKSRFNKVLEYLKEMNINFEVDPMIVRGLDYYTHTIFEIEASIEGFGSQNVMCGGGRYDHLVENLGGPSTPGIGFAFGLERLLAAIEAEHNLNSENQIHLFIIALGDKARLKAMKLVNDMRLGGLITEMDYLNGKLKNQFKMSEKYHARYIGILGDTELENNVINVKTPNSTEQVTIPLDSLYSYVVNKLRSGSCSGCSSSCGDCNCDCEAKENE
ncbi:MAG: histidine--tRNA ligase [Acholeplasmatales bacterium]|nr:histidine--tRNA ligase [Acholeplasmatales bacterium]